MSVSVAAPRQRYGRPAGSRLVGGNGRAGNRQVVTGVNADAVAAQQAAFLARGRVISDTVAAAFQEALFLRPLFTEG